MIVYHFSKMVCNAGSSNPATNNHSISIVLPFLWWAGSICTVNTKDRNIIILAIMKILWSDLINRLILVCFILLFNHRNAIRNHKWILPRLYHLWSCKVSLWQALSCQFVIIMSFVEKSNAIHYRWHFIDIQNKYKER